MTEGQGWEWDIEADAAAAAGSGVPPPPPSGVGRPLSTPGKRLGSAALDLLLIVATCGIGWLIWSMIVWAEGKTPAKQILGMRVLEEYDGRPANWGAMMIRELIAKNVCAIPVALTLGVLLFMPLWDPKRQAIWDRLASTVVIDDR